MSSKAFLLLVLLLPAWSGVCIAAPKNPDVGGDFTLTDHESRRFELEQLRGKVVLMYFGYTSCPDVCPIELANMSQFVDSLGSKKNNVQVLFVTVDPARDTPARLKEYVGFFHEDFIGLSGSDEEIDRVKDVFHVQSRIYRESADAAEYSVDHNASLFVIDQTGKLVNIVPFGFPLSHVANILQQLFE